MRLEKDLWIENGYYIDFDKLGQFRIIGPNNHLYCGLVDIPFHKIKIKKVTSKNHLLFVKGEFCCPKINLYYPAMDDIRTMREFIKKEMPKKPLLSFLEIRHKFFDKLIPLIIKKNFQKEKKEIIFRRYYGKYFYGTRFIFSKETKIKEIKTPYRGFELKNKRGKIKFEIIAETNDFNKKEFKNIFLPGEIDFSLPFFKKLEKSIKSHSHSLSYFWKRTAIEIKHLIEWGKTSGDAYGTIFPRDWMESADLGVHDLTPEVRHYMYEVTLKNVNEKGEGWHEDVVGEYKFQHEAAGRDIFDRHMIDIEPHIIMGLKELSEVFLQKKENKEKICLVAQYLYQKAKKGNLITFKKIPGTNEYYLSGNWRDSEWAFKKVSPLIAPFDVNAVFYPVALKILKKYQEKIGLKFKDLDNLIKKWSKVKYFYRFKNNDGSWGYALALYGIKRKNKIIFEKLKVNHLDESYLYTYDKANEKEIVNFCQRLLNKKYLYTESGPLLVENENKYGYTTAEYHGKVNWIKQTAFVVLGLSKHLKLGLKENWNKSSLRLIKKTILKTSENTLRAFLKLDALPELYYDKKGEPHFFTDQPQFWGEMSKVQLWSAIGARRIIRKYYELLTSKDYKNL